MAMFIRIFAAFVCLNFLSTALTAEETIDELFARSIKVPESWDVADSSDGVRWHDEKIDISIFVAGKEKGKFLKSLHEEFEKDAHFLSSKSGKTIDLNLWSGGIQKSSIYIFAGSKKDIVEWGSKLDELFGEGFSEQISELVSREDFLCFSSLTLGKGDKIERSVIVVDRNDHPNYCLRRQLIHSFGLVGTLPIGIDSILVENRVVEFYSILDSVLLKMLYLSERT